MFSTYLKWVVVTALILHNVAGDTCSPPDSQLQEVHDTCRSNWQTVFDNDNSLEVFNSLCPNLCSHSGNDDGSVESEGCVWDIACGRCQGILSVCDTEIPALKAYCQSYIDENEGYPDLERCPQYELCQPSETDMAAVRGKCEEVYTTWQAEYEDEGKSPSELSNPCDTFCEQSDEDCSYRIVCRKCKILMGFLKDTDEIISTLEDKFSSEDRCSHYAGDTMPYWWVSGNFV